MKTPVWFALAAALTAGVIITAASDAPDPFAFFAPSIQVTAHERARLDEGELVVRVLPADDGHLAVFAAARLQAGPSALIAWTRAIDALKRGPLVLGVGRFSDPAVDDDLDALALEKNELDALKRCRVGSCDLKLAATEIADVQYAIRAAGTGWRDAAQRAFRRVLIARVRLHRDRGLLALPPYTDRGRRMSVGEAFSAMVARSPYLTRNLPDLVNALLTPPHYLPDEDESFYYWSRERYGAGRTVITVTYVHLRSRTTAPQAVSVSTQLFASHYTEGALSVTAVSCDDERSACYLAYVNRSQVDVLGGLFGAVKRAVIEGRIESDTPMLLRGVRQRLESGPPDLEGGES